MHATVCIFKPPSKKCIETMKLVSDELIEDLNPLGAMNPGIGSS